MPASRVVRAFASLRLAVVVMVALGVACAAATFYEASHGTAAAQRVFYRSPWFAALLALLAASIFFSAVERYPWNRHQLGFVAAHAGILLLLAGSLVSLHAGLDGRLAIAEGDGSDRIALDGEALTLALPGRAPADATPSGGRVAAGGRAVLPPGVVLEVEEVEPNAQVDDVWAEGAAGQDGPPAVQLTVHGPTEPLSVWLMEGEPDVALGPLTFALRRDPEGPPPGPNALTLVPAADGLRYAITTRRGPGARGAVAAGASIETPWMDLSVTVDRFLAHAVRQRVVRRLPAGGRTQAGPAALVHVTTAEGGARTWVAFGETVPLALGSGAALSWAPPEGALPFRVTLLDFRSDTYPGSRMAATYESRVRVDDADGTSSESTIGMNRPLHHRGYTLFQSSYVDGPRQTSILSVSRAPGLPLVYLGTALVAFGALWMSFGKRWLARRQGRAALASRRAGALVAHTAVALLALGGAGTAAAAGDPLAEIAVLDGGRVKPLDTFARESARRISGARPFTGGETVRGMAAVDWLVSVLAEPARWRSEPVVRVAHADLRARLGLPAGRDRFSYDELAAHEGVRAAFAEAREALERGDELDASLSEVAALDDTLALFHGLTTGAALRVVPSGGDWSSVADLAAGGPAVAAPLLDRVSDVVTAEARGDRAGRAQAAFALRDALREAGGAHYPTRAALSRELAYNRFKPFRLAWLLHLAGFLALLASLPSGSRWLGRAGLALTAAGLGSATAGLLLRTLVSGRAPVTNMYESVVFVAWGAVALALAFEAVYGGRLAAACASGLAVVALVMADNVPILDGSIAPLVPVLRDNLWLTLHVLTITLGYAAFFLAMGLGHVSLALFAFAPSRRSLEASLTLFLHRSLQVGTLFLAVGTLLGGVWASYSWGRFWGWDPKETWALIALLGYLAVLHGRLAGWLGGFGLAMGAVGCFLLVLMAWYGVNYVLGTGLHAYGFGSGGAGYAFAFAAVELVVLVFALARHTASRRPQPAPALAAVRS